MTAEQLEATLDAAMQKFVASGGRIVSGEWGVDVGAITGKVECESKMTGPCACAFGAWAVTEQLPGAEDYDIDDLIHMEAHERLDVGGSLVDAFLAGFDGYARSQYESSVFAEELTFYDAGRRLAVKYGV